MFIVKVHALCLPVKHQRQRPSPREPQPASSQQWLLSTTRRRSTLQARGSAFEKSAVLTCESLVVCYATAADNRLGFYVTEREVISECAQHLYVRHTRCSQQPSYSKCVWALPCIAHMGDAGTPAGVSRRDDSTVTQVSGQINHTGATSGTARLDCYATACEHQPSLLYILGHRIIVLADTALICPSFDAGRGMRACVCSALQAIMMYDHTDAYLHMIGMRMDTCPPVTPCPPLIPAS